MLSQQDILYEDSWIIAINKPSGLFTQAAYGVPNLQVELCKYLQARDQTATSPYVGIIHRLDRPTSGVLLYGRNASAVRQMNEQFRERTTVKCYLALVKGVTEAQGIAEDWMRKISDVAKAEICSSTDADAKFAKLNWTRIASCESHSLMRVHLETGRMHQIRVQLASRGYPIVGDSLYDLSVNGDAADCLEDNEAEANQTSDPRTQVFGLHAEELKVRHPKNAKLLTLKAPIPRSWADAFPWIRSIDA